MSNDGLIKACFGCYRPFDFVIPCGSRQITSKIQEACKIILVTPENSMQLRGENKIPGLIKSYLRTNRGFEIVKQVFSSRERIIRIYNNGHAGTKVVVIPEAKNKTMFNPGTGMNEMLLILCKVFPVNNLRKTIARFAEEK